MPGIDQPKDLQRTQSTGMDGIETKDLLEQDTSMATLFNILERCVLTVPMILRNVQSMVVHFLFQLKI